VSLGSRVQRLENRIKPDARAWPNAANWRPTPEEAAEIILVLHQADALWAVPRLAGAMGALGVDLDTAEGRRALLSALRKERR